MSFGTILFTEKGRALQAKATAGTALVFTKIAMGSGYLNGQSQITLTNLIDTKVTVSISEVKRNGQQATIKGNFTNANEAVGFYWREIGLFATDPDLGEILYCYGNAGVLAEYIPPESSSLIEKVISIVAVVGDAANVSAVIDSSVFASKADIVDINSQMAAKVNLTDFTVLKNSHDSMITSAGNYYYKCLSTDANALLVVASGATTNQINISDVTPRLDTYTPVVGDYVRLVSNGLTTETVDLRIDIYGKTQASAGVAVRGQINELKNTLGGKTRNLLNNNRYTVDGSVACSDNVFTNIKTDTKSYLQLKVEQFNNSTSLGNIVYTPIATVGKKTYTFTAIEGVNRIRVSHDGSSVNLRIYFDNVNLVVGQTYTFSINIIGLAVGTVGGFSFKDVQIELGTTASDFIPSISASDYILREKAKNINLLNDRLDILKSATLTSVNGFVNTTYISSSSSGKTFIVKLEDGKKYSLVRNITDNYTLMVGFADNNALYANVTGRKIIKHENNYIAQEYNTNPYVVEVPAGYPYLAVTYYFDGHESTYTADEILQSLQLYKYEYTVDDVKRQRAIDTMISPLNELFADEITNVINEARSKMTSKALVLGIITDTHNDADREIYNLRAMQNMRAVNDALSLDICANLGDLIDGGEIKTTEANYLSNGVKYLLNVGAKKTFAIVGNHDGNELAGSGQRFTEAELYGYMQRFNETNVIRNGITSNFYIDYEQMKIRVICVNSCYQLLGFSDATVTWITGVLAGAPSDYRFVILSHEPTRGALISTDSSELYNSANFERVLDSYENRIMGYIHGHTHFDNVSYVNGYPEISITCGQPYQNTSTNFPSGATAPARTIGAVTQDAWDVVIVLPEENKFEFVRFGAGNSRTVPFTNS